MFDESNRGIIVLLDYFLDLRPPHPSSVAGLLYGRGDELQAILPAGDVGRESALVSDVAGILPVLGLDEPLEGVVHLQSSHACASLVGTPWTVTNSHIRIHLCSHLHRLLETLGSDW